MSATTHKKLTAADVTLPDSAIWNKLPIAGGALGLLGVGATLAMAGNDPAGAYSSYLVAYVYWLSLALGSLAFVLIQHLTRSGWSVVVRRIAEFGAATLPLFALLFIPIAMGLHDLYHWSHHDVVEHDELLAHKAPYLNAGFFYARAAAYFVIWSVLSWALLRASLKQDETGDHGISHFFRRISPVGMALLAFSSTFAAFDWIMSTDPHWYSTIFGVIYFGGSLVAFYAFSSLVLTQLRAKGYTAGAVTTEHLHDLGKLLWAFMVFWAYVSFSQFMLYWYGNIPEETIWFEHRWVGAWKPFSIFLVLGHFVLPFLLFMSKHAKRKSGILVPFAIWMLVMHYFDLFWQIKPVFQHEHLHFGVTEVTSFIGVGGLFLAAFAMLMKKRALVPVKDPRLPESLAFENY